jgi:hypothetical protein
MFEFIKNDRDWITSKLMNHLSTTAGDKIPVWQPERWVGHALLDKFREDARPFFEKETPYFQQYNNTSIDMQNFPIQLPELPKKRINCQYWFIKLLPGQMQTMHIDPHLVDVKNPVRYSMFLQDYVPGHVFVFDDFMATNYKAGDIFEWSEPECIHACVNVSYIIRYTLQITLYD